MRLILLMVLLINTMLNAQTPAHPPTGTVSGIVKDSATDLPVEYANVILFKNDSIMVNGAITNNEGVFILNNIPFGQYKLKITYIGYTSFIKESLVLNKENRKIYLEKIVLSPDATILGNVQITAERSILQTNIDKKIFNVDKSIITQGQSASEVLENIPSVDVDMDGNVSLRGSANVTILIDGRPSALTGSDVATALKQIPASSIESVEIITNPSAKYDPEGMSGIINIKLKKDQSTGFNGIASLGAGTGERYNGTLNLNYRMKKFNFFANYSYNRRGYWRDGTTFTTNLLNDSLYFIDQEHRSEGYSQSNMVKTGADWYINKKNTLSFFLTLNNNDRQSDEFVKTGYLDSIENVYNYTRRETDEGNINNGQNVVLTWFRTFNKPKQELVVDANYSVNNGDEEAEYYENFELFEYQPATGIFKLQEHFQVNKSTVASLQTDYTHPFTTDRKMETGFRVGYRQLDSDFDADIFDSLQQTFISDSSLINHYIYDELIVAGYATYSGKLNKFSYLAGFRLEQTFTEGELINTNDVFKNEYFSFFPSLHLAYELSKTSEILVNYSRRITRPRSRQLNPFADYSDPQNLRQGNPYLDPEYINSFELSFSWLTKKVNLLTSVYFREVRDKIQHYKNITTEGITILSYENLNNSRSLGGEIIATYSPWDWWSNVLSIDMYQLELDANNISEQLSRKGFNWTTRLMSSINLKKGTSIQLSGRYASPRVITMGILNARYHADIGIKQNVLKNRGSISVRFSDIFNSRSFSLDLEGPGFEQALERKFSSQVLYFTFTYNFGKQLRNGRKKPQKSNNNQNGGDDDMIF